MAHLPKKRYQSWGDLIVKAYHHGVQNMDATHLHTCTGFLVADLEDSFLRGADPPWVRPSSGLNCQGITALTAEGFGTEEEELPRTLFASGHFWHNLTYAALLSALPEDAFVLNIEEEVDLSPLEWWPVHERYKSKGHIDLQIRCLDSAWLPEGESLSLVADIKTKHSLGMSKIPSLIEPSNDVWGNLSQLAVYSALKGTIESGALLIYLNREAPKAKGKQIKVKRIFPEALLEELENVKRRIVGEFSPELWLRKQAGEKTFMPCQGYCDVQAECERRREGWEV
jgi:hypothetical protein